MDGLNQYRTDHNSAVVIEYNSQMVCKTRLQKINPL